MESIQSTMKNINLYDIKAAVRKAQNVVMNYTSMEARVREATNNEPWGASTSLMMEIAQGTHNYSQLNEILPMIYRRFTEKTAEEWRQIYKALQLLEFLVKNGSERVVDDARAHQATIKMLRNFHYIDHRQKDQGLNVRTRAKELVELLNDSERIRKERKRARQNRGKFIGVGSDGDSRISTSSKSRFPSFGSSRGSYRTRVYGDGGGFTDYGNGYHDSSSMSDSRDASDNDVEEYNEDGDGGSSDAATANSTRGSRRTTTKQSDKAPEQPKQESAMIDLLGLDNEPSPAQPQTNTSAPLAFEDDGFGDFQSSAAAPASSTLNNASLFMGSQTASTAAKNDDDAFDDFQSAPSAKPASNTAAFSSISFGGFNSLNQLPTSSSAFTPQPTTFNTGYTSAFGMPSGLSNTSSQAGLGLTSQQPTAAKSSGSNGDAFGSLWSSAVNKVHQENSTKERVVSSSSEPVSKTQNFLDNDNLLL
ncbi:ENTH/VHS domain-containing protein Ent3 [Schizosaccharomyces pombe]